MIIRQLHGFAEYREAEQVQMAVWGRDELEVVPDHILHAINEFGGVVLGAFVPNPDSPGERLIGVVFGFVGRHPEGRTVHYSHVAAVLPTYRSLGVGYQLKLAQRDVVLQQGIEIMCWTYDPLLSRNANLNIHKLGATCHSYIRNCYGPMRDALNQGLDSDRFLVDWHLNSPHVQRRQRSNHRETLPSLQARGIALVNPPAANSWPTPPIWPETPQLLVAIPSDIDALKQKDLVAALAWREHSRMLFESAFAAGYVVMDLVPDSSYSYYLLSRDWSPYAD